MRNKNLIKILFALFASSLFSRPSSLFAAFENTGTGARGAALGDNYAAMGDDVHSLMYNPAALARVQQKEISTEYSRLYTGLSDGSNLSQSFLGYGQPISWGGTVAIGWKQFSLDQLYRERTLSLGYGEWLTENIAIGGAVKQLYHSFGVPNMIVDNNGNVQSGTPNFFAQNGNSNTAYSADLGALYKWSGRSTLGVSIQDVNEPNIALNPADHEIVPRTIRVANSYEADRHLTMGLGMTREQNLTSQTDTIWTGSAEKMWRLVAGDEVTIRGSVATGSREFQQAALGAGYLLNQFQIDYAFVFNLTGITPGSTAGTHRFSVTYRFGPKGIPTRGNLAKKTKPKQMPQGYEQPVHEALENSAVAQGVPSGAPRVLPRAVDLTITPEEVDESATPGQLLDLSINMIFDSDNDGIPDDRDLCPNTPPGVQVDDNGCAPSQLDHHGNPLPRQVDVQMMPLDEVQNGH
jgi:hypothetical protein